MSEIDVGSVGELAEGAMRGIDVQGRRVLLARVDGVCHAVGGTCPHAGAPLDEGILSGGAVLCPWHKAAFDVATGRNLEPPAVDDLPRYAVAELDGRLKLSLPEFSPASELDASESDPRCFVIVGAGAAGSEAARILRAEGFAGRLVLVGQEDRLPYDRTVLSKYALSGQQGGEKTPLHDAAFYTRHEIERLTAEVVALDPRSRCVRFAEGGGLAFDAALLATGGAPRRLDVPGAELPGVFLLRSAADAEAIAAQAAQAHRAVVVGTGFIAVEAAASLRERGLAVTVVGPDAVPFLRVLGEPVGAAFRRVLECQGVQFRKGNVVAVEGTGRVEQVRMEDGAVLPAGLLVLGLGVQPATHMLRGVALRDDGALTVDATLRAADGLYAAGDIAAFPMRGDGAPVRVEHWRVALQQGRVAGLNMLGRGVRFDAVPYFWSILFRKRLDYVGHATQWDSLDIDGDLDAPDFLAFYVQEGAVAAVAGWGRDQQMARALTLMSQRRHWPVADLRAALAG